MSFTEFFFAADINPLLKLQVMQLIFLYLNLADDITFDVTLAENQQVVQVTTTCRIIVEMLVGGFSITTVDVTIVTVNGVVQEIKIVVIVHKSGVAG